MALIRAFISTQLPESEMKVKARKISLITLMTKGLFPSELTSMVVQMFDQKVELDAAALRNNPAVMKELFAVIEAIVPLVLVEPTIGTVTALTEDVDGFAIGTIRLDDIPDLDKQYLFYFGQGLARQFIPKRVQPSSEPLDEEVTPTDVASFRDGAARPDTGLPGEALRDQAVDSVGVVPAESTGA